MIDKIKAAINPDDRIIMAKRILPLKFPVEQQDRPYMKPNGLWYAVGLEWIEWVENEMPHWIGNVFYKIEVNPNKILHLKTRVEIMEFSAKFRADGKMPTMDRDTFIDWKRVSEIYSGIEISPYQYSLRFTFMWYYGWDVTSGCIWAKDGIKNIKKIKV
jgi:hypothetical protein